MNMETVDVVRDAAFVLEPMLKAIGALVAAVLVPLLVIAARVLRAKLGLERLVSDQVIETTMRDVVDHGLAYAEQWAETQARQSARPAGAEKLKRAAGYIAAEIVDRDLPQRAGPWIERTIEARLGHPAAPGGVTHPIAVSVEGTRPPALLGDKS